MDSKEIASTNDIKESKCDKRLIAIKMHYFVFYAALGCGFPYRTVFAKQLGLSGILTGVIFAISPFAKMITNPLFGSTVDKTKKFRMTIIFCILLGAFLSVIPVIVPPLKSNYNITTVNVTFNCKRQFPFKSIATNIHTLTPFIYNEQNFKCSFCNDSYFQFCKMYEKNKNIYYNTKIISSTRENNLSKIVLLNNTAEFLFASSSAIYLESESIYTRMLNCSMDVCSTDEENFNTNHLKEEFVSIQFWSLAILYTLSASCFAAVMFLTDAVCYEILGDKLENYGFQRFWGSFGYGVGTLLSGYLDDVITNTSEPDFRPCFYIASVLSAINVIPVAFVKVKDIEYSSSISQDIKKLVSNIYIVNHIVMAFFVGILSGPIWNFLTWFLEDMGASSLLMGLALSIECFFAEIPCFIISGWVIKKIGHDNCTSLAFLCFGIRYLWLSYLKDPWLSLPASFLHGPTFGIYFASLTCFGKENASPGTEATVQSILASTFEGSGVSFGTLLGGILINYFGSRETLWYLGIASMILLAINLSLRLLIKRWKP